MVAQATIVAIAVVVKPVAGAGLAVVVVALAAAGLVADWVVVPGLVVETGGVVLVLVVLVVVTVVVVVVTGALGGSTWAM